MFLKKKCVDTDQPAQDKLRLNCLLFVNVLHQFPSRVVVRYSRHTSLCNELNDKNLVKPWKTFNPLPDDKF